MVQPYSMSCSPSSHGLLHTKGDSTGFFHNVSNYLPIHRLEHPKIYGGAEIPDSF
jgi:hypothetical protein